MYSTVSPSCKQILILDIWRNYIIDIKASSSFPLILVLNLDLIALFYSAFIGNGIDGDVNQYINPQPSSVSLKLYQFCNR